MTEPTLDEILAWNAEHVHGWIRTERGWCEEQCYPPDAKLSYFLTGNGMVETMEKMRDDGWRVHCCVSLSGRWIAELFRGEAIGPRLNEFTAPTLPEAVQRAVYAAMREKQR